MKLNTYEICLNTIKNLNRKKYIIETKIKLKLEKRNRYNYFKIKSDM